MDYRFTKAELLAMEPAKLVEGFLREAKLSEAALNGFTKAEEGDAHVHATTDYGKAISERGGLASLVPLLDSEDPFIAYTVGDLLVEADLYRQQGLAALSRVSNLNCGVASVRADRAYNMVVYGQPGNPADLERIRRKLEKDRQDRLDRARRSRGE